MLNLLNRPLTAFIGEVLQAKLSFKKRYTRDTQMQVTVDVEVIGIDRELDVLLAKPLTKDPELLDALPNYLLKIKKTEIEKIY